MDDVAAEERRGFAALFGPPDADVRSDQDIELERRRKNRSRRARTDSMSRYPKKLLDAGRAEYPEDTAALRPTNRTECRDGHRPCPFVSCEYHLYLDINERNGSLRLNFPDKEVWQVPYSCALDVADRGRTTLKEVGTILSLTREAVRRIEARGLAKLKLLSELAKIQDSWGWK